MFVASTLAQTEWNEFTSPEGDGTEKAFRMVMEEIRNLIGAGKEKGISKGQRGE
jgi:hypothetical protein